MTSKSCPKEYEALDFCLFSWQKTSCCLFQLLVVTKKNLIKWKGTCRHLTKLAAVCLLFLQLCVQRVRSLRNKGPKFRFHKYAADGKEGKEGKGNSRSRLMKSIPVIIIVLILFSALFLVSIRQILCNPSYSLLPGSFPPSQWTTLLFQSQHLGDSESWWVFSYSLVTCSCSILLIQVLNIWSN